MQFEIEQTININKMKKALIIVTLLALMGNAFAQNQGTKEYVSALITFIAESNVPQDSLDKYGVIIQTRSGRMATALIDAEQYQSFLMSNLVERVQPSTRVFLHSNQIKEDGVRIDTPHRQQVKFNEQPDKREDVRHHIIPEEDIRNDEAKGWYIGLMLGGSSNNMQVKKAMWDGKWYSQRGLNVEARAGYQFNEWFGIRSGLSLVSKNYSTDLNISYNGTENKYQTYHQNQYLQLPVMADLSLGGESVRIHFMAGGYAAFWASQYRDGYIYVAGDSRPYTGWTYRFIKGYDYRFEAGLAGGIGLTMQVTPAWQLHFEGNYYHGLISTAKKPYKTFNRTWTFGMGLTYHF